MFRPLLLIVFCTCQCLCDVDPVKTLVWGPGLAPHLISLPVRYFFIHAVHENGEKFNSTTPKEFWIDISGVNSRGIPCLLGKEVLNRKDGSFIVRYRLRETCETLTIKITYRGKHIAQSPYISTDPVHAEDCACPVNSLESWINLLRCPYSYPQIEKDLQPFSQVNFTKYFDVARKIFNRPEATSYCHYVVKDNKVYRTCYGKHVGFNKFMDAILLSMARKVKLPDMELLVNLGDWPLITQHIKNVIPMFSWCGSDDSADIVMPTYDLTESTLEAMNRVSLDILSLQGNIDYSWNEKIEKAFWRGRDSSRERLDLVRISRVHKDLIDAAITHVFFFRNKIKEIEPLQERISFFKFFDYKYQINMDGTVAAYRFPYLLAGDSVILKQESQYYEHFYKDLKPWQHYIPVKRDLSDLVYRIKWAKDHDVEARNIASRSREYVQNNLLPADILCYHGVLFQEWSKRLQGKVKINKEMEEAPQPQPKFSCNCPNAVKKNIAKDEL